MDKTFNKVLVGAILVLVLLVVGGVYIYKQTHQPVIVSSVTAVGKVCNGSEPTTQLCNVNTYELESQTDITAVNGIFSGGYVALEAINGGGLLATTTGNTTTLSAAQICDNGIISVTAGLVASVAVTLPATTTLAATCIPNVGDTRTFLYENASTAATNTTITAGAGNTLISDDTNGDVIAQNGWAEISITNVRASDFAVVVRPFTDAD